MQWVGTNTLGSNLQEASEQLRGADMVVTACGLHSLLLHVVKADARIINIDRHLVDWADLEINDHAAKRIQFNELNLF